ncbi:MAG: hypothetical protein AAF985_14050, partial [Bacteroidota bacterium]
TRIWSIMIVLLVSYSLYEIIILWEVNPKDFFCLSKVFNSLAIVIMSIVFYIAQIARDHQAKPTFFLLNTIIFAFHSLNLILYLPINFLINENSNIKFYFWSISLVLTLLFYLSIIHILWIHGKNRIP